MRILSRVSAFNSMAFGLLFKRWETELVFIPVSAEMSFKVTAMPLTPRFSRNGQTGMADLH